VISYKVVHKEYRYGTNLSIYFGNLIGFNHYKRFFSDLQSYQKKYFPLYLKDLILEAPEESPGFLLFKTRTEAEDFIDNELYMYSNALMILRIQTISEVKNIKRKKLFFECGYYISRVFDKNLHYEFTRNPPDGTIGCHKIKVLD